LEKQENVAKHRDWFLADEEGAQRLSEVENDIPRLTEEERQGLRQKLKNEIEKQHPSHPQLGNREELYERLETWVSMSDEYKRFASGYKKIKNDGLEKEFVEVRWDEDKGEYFRVEQDGSQEERYDELADVIVELMGTDTKREDLFEKLTAWVDEYEDLCPEWIYWRILRHLNTAPVIEEGYKGAHDLLKETATFFQSWSRNIERRKGKRKPRAEYSDDDYPKLEFQYLDESGEKVKGQYEAPGIVITPDEHGSLVQRVPGYGAGVPLNRDKLEDELLVELYSFLLRKDLPPKDAYYLLKDIFLAFFGKSLSWRTIQTRILPRSTD
jgi:hypothetical protein